MDFITDAEVKKAILDIRDLLKELLKSEKVNVKKGRLSDRIARKTAKK